MRPWPARRRRGRPFSDERERAFEVGAFPLDLVAIHRDLHFPGLGIVVLGDSAFAHVVGQRTLEALVFPCDFSRSAVLRDRNADVLRAHLIPEELPFSGEGGGLRRGGQKEEA